MRAEVLGRIRSGLWGPGTMIPTEHELALELGCARATVNRALRELADNGILQRRRKVGTRVTARATRRSWLELPSIREEIEARGAAMEYRLSDFRLCPAPAPVQQALQTEDGARLAQITTVYLSDGVPHCCEVIWLTPSTLPDFDRATFEADPPHEWLARSVPVTEARFSILAESATEPFSEALSVPDHAALLTIERTNLLDEAPVSYARQFYAPGHRLALSD
ncbi:MAG: GntR family transcriptional regulator [Paracoccus sp. (in: a-proteobacteria)]|uniref:GntR family transcriptional regulator n=1 Tax=Paracoccus sp. TaxID=267 RepID=UPI00391965B6